MKKILLPIVIFFLFYFCGFSQSTRLVLLEEFTSSTCGPCVNANTKIKGWLAQYPTTFTAVFYHMNWPAPGNDPMYLHNTIDNSARKSYYNVGTVPYSVVDGNVWTGNGNYLEWTTISNRQAVPSPFDLQLRHEISAGNDSVYLTMIASATQPATGTLVAHNVVIEKYIHFTSPPGTNGEKDFPNVMKKMLPGKEGSPLPAPMEVGDYLIVETAWAFANVYNVNEIAGVSFIQNNATKEVLQAANSTTDAITLPYDNDLQVLEISNISETNCSGIVSPIINVRNNGNNPVTSFTINYMMNNGTLSTFSWNGNIAPLEKAVVTLPDYSFTPEATNILSVYTSNPNTIGDEYPKNDTMTTTLVSAPITTFTVYLFLRTDNAPEDITWDVKDMQGQVIQSGGPYTNAMTMYRDTIDVPAQGCYLFTIYAAGGHGICCTNGNGLYFLEDSEGTEIKQGGTFGYYDLVEFNANLVSAREIFDQTRALQVYPNPAAHEVTVSFYLTDPNPVGFALYNTIGQIVQTFQPGYLTSGNHEIKVDVSAFQPGVYYLKMTTGSKVYTRKLTLTK